MSPPVEARAEAPESSSESTGFEPPVPPVGVPGDVGPVGVPGLVTVAASTPPQLAALLPSSPTPLPHTMTGALIGADTSDPPVGTRPLLLALSPGNPTTGCRRHPTELPQTVTGAVTGACAERGVAEQPSE